MSESSKPTNSSASSKTSRKTKSPAKTSATAGSGTNPSGSSQDAKSNTSALTSQDSILGRLVIEQGLATVEEVREAVSLKKKEATGTGDDAASVTGSGSPAEAGASGASDATGTSASAAASSASSLGDLLVSTEVITRKQLDRLRPMIEDQRSPQQIPGFQILGKLGAGAMATVYKAKQISLDRLVAVKVLPKKHTNSPQFVERFYAEGRAAAKLNHPNIVGALDVGKAGEFHYFVMEYVKGRTVYDDIVEMKRYNEKRALEVVAQTCLALEHAHAAGFVHRDVKPKNIMIADDKEKTVKLADMGLARAVSDREAAEAEKGKAHGTPYYISPEQIRGVVDIDFRADIYCLGATFYHMVTGVVPFDGSNPSAVMHKHLKEDLVPPDEINPELSNGISEIIEVAMMKDRDERYASTSEMLEDLRAVQSGEPPIHARKKFDLDSLSALETQSAAPTTETLQRVEPKSGIAEQPLFWVAVGGWALAILVLIVLIVILSS